VLPLPDNELDELADNFFCHLHTHEHNHDEQNDKQSENISEPDLLNSLNPLAFSLNSSKLISRMSVLFNRTLFILNQNHLNSNDISKWYTQENSIVTCPECSWVIGYRSSEIF
jgi:predicted enzyme involved in methoxymalonyl-ACP biosynthesis